MLTIFVSATPKGNPNNLFNVNNPQYMIKFCIVLNKKWNKIKTFSIITIATFAK